MSSGVSLKQLCTCWNLTGLTLTDHEAARRLAELALKTNGKLV
jgi:hypothetical protein